jgi:hypothetical protein
VSRANSERYFNEYVFGFMESDIERELAFPDSFGWRQRRYRSSQSPCSDDVPKGTKGVSGPCCLVRSPGSSPSLCPALRLDLRRWEHRAV